MVGAFVDHQTLGRPDQLEQAVGMLDRVNGKPMKSELWYIDASGKANITPYKK